MTWVLQNRASQARLTAILSLALALAGCDRNQIHSYTAPKDGVIQDLAAGGAPSDSTSAAAPASTPAISYDLPSNWQEMKAEDVVLKAFQAKSAKGGIALVGISRLANLAGREAMLVNMWRGQAGLPEIPEDAALQSIQSTEFAGGQGSYFEVTGQTTNGPMEILVAFTHRPDGSWFCKMTGDPDTIADQKPTFLKFLKSIQLTAPAAPVAPVAVASTTSGVPGADAHFNWTVPANWQAVAAGQMQVAVFNVPARGGGKGEVSVSVFPNEAGNTLVNINRWRTKYVGLTTIEEKDLPPLLSPLDPAVPGAVLVDMKNGDKQLIGAIVPRAGQYWYYKLVGEPAAVAPEKDDFIAFVKSTP